MKKSFMLMAGLLLVVFMNGSLLYAQQDTVAIGQQAQPEKKKKRDLKNTVRFNLTNPVLLSSNSIIFGYERVLWNNQTVSVNLGQNQMRDLGLLDPDINSDEIQLTRNAENKGYNFSIDYRFYLKKLNAWPAPRGVYVAPFYSFNNFHKKNSWLLNTNTFQGELNTEFNVDIHTLGVELGYQFVFWRRVALDLVLFGPGMASYAFSTELSTTLSAEDEALLFEKINEFLSDRFPGYTFAIDDAEFKKSGTAKITSVGFRYMIQLGFRF
jgi:hypothetical protein